jgi:hypothetical protein
VQYFRIGDLASLLIVVSVQDEAVSEVTFTPLLLFYLYHLTVKALNGKMLFAVVYLGKRGKLTHSFLGW